MNFRFVCFASVAAALTVGPVEQAVNLLAKLKGKVAADQEADAAIAEEQDRWCRKTQGDKEHAIATAGSLIEEKQACIESQGATAAANEAVVAEEAARLAAAQGDLEAATKIRNSEAALFQEKEAELSEAVDTLESAILLIRKKGGVDKVGQVGSFTQMAKSLSTVVDAMWIPMADRSKLQQFLQQQEDDQDFGFENPKAYAYEGRSRGILDTLGDIRDKAEDALNEARREEMEAKHNFEMLQQSLEGEIAVSNKKVSESQAVRSEAQQIKANCESVKATAEKSIADDKSYLGSLVQACKLQAEDFVHNSASRQAEIAAIEEAMDILTKSSALAAAGKSLLQVSNFEAEKIHRAQKFLSHLSRELDSVALAQMAFRIAEDPFAKVRGMIQQMISRLEQQAQEEATHKSWCDDETKSTVTKLGSSSQRLSTLTDRIDSAAAQIQILQLEAKELHKEINSIDIEQAEATKLRHESNEANTAQIKDAEEAQSALRKAIQVLRNYYESHAASPSFLQKASVSPPLPSGIVRRTDAEHADHQSGIIGILEVAESNFLNMETEMRALEESQEQDYLELKQKNTVSRAAKAAEAKGKEAEIKILTNSKVTHESDRNSEQEGNDALRAYQEKLKKNCEYTVPPFEKRAAQREAEIRGLRDALAILSGEGVASVPSEGTDLLQKKRLLAVRKHV